MSAPMKSIQQLQSMQLVAMTHEERVYRHLASGQPLNPLYAWTRYGVYRLADVIYKLKKRGIKINNEGMDVDNQFGEKCRIGKYVLAKE
jgi:hypothetical protein